MATPLTAVRFHSTLAGGIDNAGGKLYTYAAGTTTPRATYTTAALSVANANPVILDSTGRAAVWLDPALAYKFVITDAAGVAAPDGTVDNFSDGAGSLLGQLADHTDEDLGGGLVGFDGQLNYAAATIGWAQKLGGILPEWFGAVGDGTTDDTAAVAAAISFAAALTGPQYADTMGQSPYQYGASRRLKLSGKKYLINSTLTLAADVGIYAEGGGFVAGASFPTANYMIDTGTNPYGGRVSDLTLDGGDRNVKGVRIQNAHNTRWRGISVVSCRNDGITYEAGAEFYLTDFEVSGSASPTAVTVAGLRVLGSDARFSNGVIKYTPIGVASNGGGNCEYTEIHCWGLYASFKQYVSFWFVNSVRNSITACYADSPTKQDYAQANTVALNSIPNGGVGFYFDANSTQNTLVACRGYVNTTAYAAASLPGADHFYDVYTAAQFTTVLGLVHNYAGNWLGDVLFASNTVRDSSFVAAAAVLANGLRASSVYSQSDMGGGTQAVSIENTNNSFATSAAQLSLVIGGSERGALRATYGSAGASYVSVFINSTAEFLRVTNTGTVQAGTDNAQNLGSGSVRWATVYAATGTINTSDERAKQDIRDASVAEKAVALRIKGNLKAFRFKDAVQEKGDAARTHFGVIAQDVAAAFRAEGLDPDAYGMFCFDQWDEQPELRDDKGEVIQPFRAAGDRYGVRYEELLAFIVAAL